MKRSGFLASALDRLAHLRVVDRRNLYSAVEASHLRRLLALYDVDCVFDVGGNFGQHAEMLRQDAKFAGLIVTFEPNPVAAARLREMAGLQHDWLIEEVALSDVDGEAPFNVMVGSAFSSLSAPRHDEVGLFTKKNRIERTVQVRTETLTTAFHRLHEIHGFERPFLKLDTQGFDAVIVAASRDVVREFVGLQSELAVKKIYAHSLDYRAALSLYEQCGFELSAFVPNNDGHFPRMVETDCIMVRADLM